MFRKFLLCVALPACFFVVVVNAQGRPAKEHETGRSQNCDKYECPAYRVLERHKGYELREYEPATWAFTSETTTLVDYNKKIRRQMYMKLYKYFNGSNEEGVKITRTLPVLRKLSSKVLDCTTCKTTYTTFFLMPSDAKYKIPTPGPGISIEEKTERVRLYVKYFPGLKNFGEKLKMVKKLKEQIGDPRLYHPSIFYIASYDPPWQMFNRHNEVGVLAISKK